MRALCFALLLSLTAFAGREGNFVIRFDPNAILQTGAQIPFEIHVMNDLQQPLHQAKVTLQIETKDHQKAESFKAPEVTEGVYLAKPIFPDPGDWNVMVEVHRNDQVTSRSKEYTIPK